VVRKGSDAGSHDHSASRHLRTIVEGQEEPTAVTPHSLDKSSVHIGGY
jgi:hypothetical protein